MIPEDFPPLEFWANLSKNRDHFQTNSENFKNYGTLDDAVCSVERVLKLEKAQAPLNFLNCIPMPELRASEELASILNSRSWKVTKPLRLMANCMRRLLDAKNVNSK